MAKDDEVYIGSISPTISVTDVRILRATAKAMDGMLTGEEFKKIIAVYVEAADRVMEENGVNKNETEASK